MGIFFKDSKPHISKEEFKKVRNELYGKDWTHKELELVESFFETSMNEGRDSDKGIDRLEIEKGIQAMRENENLYHLSDKKLGELEAVFNKYI